MNSISFIFKLFSVIICKTYYSIYFLSWARNFLMLNSDHFETHSETHIIPWPIKIHGGELASYQ